MLAGVLVGDQNGNIAAGALKHAHIPAQLIRRHWRGRRTVLDKGYDPARLRKSLARCEPATGGRTSRARHAAETKMAARKQVFLSQSHGFLLTVLRFPTVIAQDVAPGRSFCSVADKPRRTASGGIETPQCCRLVGARLYWFAPALEHRLIASPMLKGKA